MKLLTIVTHYILYTLCQFPILTGDSIALPIPLVSQGYYKCSSFNFFELGSCHHPHYLVNLHIHRLPLDTEKDYAGISMLNQIDLFVSTVNLYILAKPKVSETGFYHHIAELKLATCSRTV